MRSYAWLSFSFSLGWLLILGQLAGVALQGRLGQLFRRQAVQKLQPAVSDMQGLPEGVSLR